ncbi:hypothetical protein REC12_11990 [Desulfosporosinus sp. PR]|uniref:hypothetical protein n=1 Tax=Candidatus Desulfosporosinus nitrosoreducens TaxID=3401928 RepID=UPI0027F38A09|nr:hypothetical protein [Desulfosporosinus sp. PR]MDQ7094311.1 hypothetical protein [Desulfosporosinus sp. PR]
MKDAKEIIIFIALSALLLIGIGFLPKSVSKPVSQNVTSATPAVNYVVQSSDQIQ